MKSAPSSQGPLTRRTRHWRGSLHAASPVCFPRELLTIATPRGSNFVSTASTVRSKAGEVFLYAYLGIVTSTHHRRNRPLRISFSTGAFISGRVPPVHACRSMVAIATVRFWGPHVATRCTPSGRGNLSVTLPGDGLFGSWMAREQSLITV